MSLARPRIPDTTHRLSSWLLQCGEVGTETDAFTLYRHQVAYCHVSPHVVEERVCGFTFFIIPERLRKRSAIVQVFGSSFDRSDLSSVCHCSAVAAV